MSDPTILVEFEPKRGRFVTDITRAQIQRWDEPPVFLFENKLADRIEHPETPRFPRHFRYVEKVAAVWKAMQSHTQVPRVKLVLAQGCPDLAGVSVEIDPSRERVVLLTLPQGADLATWRPSQLEAYVNFQLSKLQVDGVVNAAQLRTAYARAAFHNELIAKYPLSIRYRAAGHGFSGPYHIVTDHERHEVDLLVADVSGLRSQAFRDRMFAEIDEALWRLSADAGISPVARAVRNDLEPVFDEAIIGPQSIGFDLPLVLPGGFFLRDEATHPRLSDPATLLRLIGSKPFRTESVENRQRRDQMLERRGVLRDGSVAPKARIFPILPLETQPRTTQDRYLELARRARAALDFGDRELQALTVAIGAQSATKYADEINRFWRELCARSAGPVVDTDTKVLVWSNWLPLSHRPSEPRPLFESDQAFDKASWLTLVVREFFGMKTVVPTPEGIASVLLPDISVKAVERALENLVASKLIWRDPADGRYKQSAATIMTGNDLPSLNVQRLHEDFSELAGAMLARSPKLCRSRAAMFRIPLPDFQKVKNELRALLEDLLTRSAKEPNPDQVFLLSAQMFVIGGA
jgi:hypothetical protein